MNRCARRLLPLLLCLGACGDGAQPRGAETSASSAAEPLDPCALIPVEEWASRTGLTDIEIDRSARDTCDYLSDDLPGVVGSVVLPVRGFMDHPPSIAGEPEPLAGLGDEARWLRLGPVVRKGEQTVWVTVNPSMHNQREIALALARRAVAGL